MYDMVIFHYPPMEVDDRESAEVLFFISHQTAHLVGPHTVNLRGPQTAILGLTTDLRLPILEDLRPQTAYLRGPQKIASDIILLC